MWTSSALPYLKLELSHCNKILNVQSGAAKMTRDERISVNTFHRLDLIVDKWSRASADVSSLQSGLTPWQKWFIKAANAYLLFYFCFFTLSLPRREPLRVFWSVWSQVLFTKCNLHLDAVGTKELRTGSSTSLRARIRILILLLIR